MTSECTIPGVSIKYKLWTLSNNGVKCRFINFNKCITWYSIAEVVRDTICRPGVHGNCVFSVQLCHEQKVLLKIPIPTSFTCKHCVPENQGSEDEHNFSLAHNPLLLQDIIFTPIFVVV